MTVTTLCIHNVPPMMSNAFVQSIVPIGSLIAHAHVFAHAQDTKEGINERRTRRTKEQIMANTINTID